MTVAGKQDLKCFLEWQFAASFMHFELRRELRKITGRWEKTRQGLDYRIIDKIICFLEGGYFRGVNLDAQKQWAGLA